MGEAQGQFQSQGCAPGEFDRVRRNRRIVPHRGPVARQQRRIAQRVVARLVEVSALGNADCRGTEPGFGVKWGNASSPGVLLIGKQAAGYCVEVLQGLVI